LSACVTTEERVFVSDVTPERAIETKVNLAMNYLYEQNNAEAARRHLTAALKLDPKSPLAHNALALVFSKEGDLELTERHFKKAISYDRKFSTAHNNYAAFLYSQGRYKEALRELEFVVDDEEYKERMLAFANLGRVALQIGDYDKAEWAFKRTLRINPNYKPGLLELAYVSFERKDYKQSQALYDQYRRATKQSARGLLLGIRLAEINVDADARASYILALRNLYPDSLEYKQYLAGKYE
jgi:type IV pilus assembly protein PilF